MSKLLEIWQHTYLSLPVCQSHPASTVCRAFGAKADAVENLTEKPQGYGLFSHKAKYVKLVNFEMFLENLSII